MNLALQTRVLGQQFIHFTILAAQLVFEVADHLVRRCSLFACVQSNGLHGDHASDCVVHRVSAFWKFGYLHRKTNWIYMQTNLHYATHLRFRKVKMSV